MVCTKRMRFAHLFLFLFLFLSLIPAKKSEATCKDVLVSAAKTTASVGYWTLTKAFRGMGHVLKTAFYPVAGTVNLSRAGYQTVKDKGVLGLWRAPIATLRQDLFHLTGYLLLFVASQGSGLTYHEYERATEEFEQSSASDTVVIVDGFSSEDPYGGAGEYVYRLRYTDNPNAHFIKAESVEQLVRDLQRISQSHGPIHKLDFYGHGLPGQIQLNQDWLDVNGEIPKNSEPPVPLEQVRFEGLFAQGAKIRFNSCFLGSGPQGEKFLNAFGNAFLDKGGTLFSAKVQILPNAIDFLSLKGSLGEPSTAVRLVGDHISVVRSAMTAPTLLMFSEDGTYFVIERVRKVEVPARE